MSRLVQALGSLLIGVMLAVGLIYLWNQHTRSAIVIAPLDVDATIVVDVRGAVATPGTVRLAAASRVSDALDAAGGLRDDSDVANLNLAARLADGQRLVIPVLPTATIAVPTRVRATNVAPTATRNPVGPQTSASGPVNINTATVAELDALPGIGEVLSGRIVAYREANGPFRAIDQLAEIDGISAKLVERLRPLVTVGG